MTAPTATERMDAALESLRNGPDLLTLWAVRCAIAPIVATLEATIARLTAPIAEDLLREVVERNAEVIRKYVPCTCDREHMEPWHQQGCLRYFNDCITTALNQHAEERRRLVAEREPNATIWHFGRDGYSLMVVKMDDGSDFRYDERVCIIRADKEATR